MFVVENIEVVKGVTEWNEEQIMVFGKLTQLNLRWHK
jgi:hypothetical protein